MPYVDRVSDATTQTPSSDTAVVLLSGGLDSTVALALTLENRPVACVLTADYGQPAFVREFRAARQIAAHYQLAHHMVPLPWMAELLQGAHCQGDAGEGFTEETRSVWVPNRNGVLLNVAAAYAEALGATAVVFGANADEGQTFPDNTSAFRHRVNQALAYSTLSGVQVMAPVEGMGKAAMICQAMALEVPLSLIWSCYDNGEAHCGLCPSCKHLKTALAKAGAEGVIAFKA